MVIKMKKEGVGKKTEYLFLLFVILVAICIRYPTTPFMLDHGNDAHHYTFLADSIIKFGEIKWVVTPISYFGIYPFSSNTAYPLFLSTISQMAGVSVDVSLFYLTISLSIIGIVGIFFLLRRLFNTPIFVFSGVFLYTLMPITVWRSSWSLTSRVFAIYLIPVFLYFLIQTSKKEERHSYATLSLITLLLLFLSHKLAFFIIPVVLSYFISGRLIKSKSIVPKSVKKHSAGIWLSILLISFFASIIPNMGIGTSYDLGIITWGPIYVKAPINAMISLSGGTNLILILVPFGLLWVLKKNAMSRMSLFSLLSVISTLPLLQFRIYSRPFVSLFIIIFGIYGLYYLKKKVNRKILATMLVSIMLLSIAFMGFMISHWASGPLVGNLFEDEDSYSRFSCVVYSNRINPKNGTFIANFWGDGRYFQSYLQMPNAPPQHGVDDSNLLIYGYISPDEVRSDVETIPLTDINGFIENEGPFRSQGLESYHISEIDAFLKRPKDSVYSTRLMQSYSSQFVLTNKAIELKYLNRWVKEPEDSIFFQSVPLTSYKYYESNSFIVWSA